MSCCGLTGALRSIPHTHTLPLRFGQTCIQPRILQLNKGVTLVQLVLPKPRQTLVSLTFYQLLYACLLFFKRKKINNTRFYVNSIRDVLKICLVCNSFGSVWGGNWGKSNVRGERRFLLIPCCALGEKSVDR